MAAVVAIINYQGKILIGKKRLDSQKYLRGEWHIPGETIEQEESDKQALIRGIREEAGIEVKVGRYIGYHITPSSKKEARWYECFSETEKVVPGGDLEDLKWISKKDVLNFCRSKANNLWPKEVKEYFQ